MLGNVSLVSSFKTTADFEIVPAILVKTREELVKQIELVKPYVKTIQIDIMDGIFVPNKTIEPQEIINLPSGIDYEFHWMVNYPENYIREIKNECLHIVHIESKMDFNKVKKTVSSTNSRLAIAINPPTTVEKIFPYEKDICQILVMSVNPGFSGQSYIIGVEEKIKLIRNRNPDLDIEIDGGINIETIKRARDAGANKLCAASAIFSNKNISKAIKDLENAARGIHNG